MWPLQAATSLALLGSLVAAAQQPNILFILTDDQDAKLNSLSYMPHVQQLLVQQGTSYLSHYCTVSLCCPSRVSMWTGKAAHNTNVTDIVAPYGGYPKFVQEGLNDDWLPVWLQNAGINMYYSGKLMNAFSNTNYNNPYPKGFAGTRFFLSPWTYLYFEPAIQQNQDAPVVYKGTYATDLLSNVTLDMIDEAVAADKPFVVVAAPVGPHSADNPSGTEPGTYPPQPANRDAQLFPNATVPRTANWNPAAVSGANWVAKLPRQSQDQINFNDYYYRRRLQTLQSIDLMVANLVNRLDSHGVLDNTFIIYSSDNGYHIGQHRLPPGKITGYEEDINVPLIIRGPGVPQGKSVNFATSHTDIAPTILNMMGLSLDHNLDGQPIPFTQADISAAQSSPLSEHVNVEFWGLPSKDGNYSYPWGGVINTYKGVRVVSQDYSFYYQVWCDNEKELYDMKADPGQMNNLIGQKGTLLGRSIPALVNRINALLLILKDCAGTTCTQPWAALQPGAGVQNLQDAMDGQWDSFYNAQPDVAFVECEVYYNWDAEAPHWDP